LTVTKLIQNVGKRPRKPSILHEPIVSNVTALIRNDIENDDLSEPPGIALPLFDDLGTDSKDPSLQDSPRKRRGRGKKNYLILLSNTRLTVFL